MPAETCFDRIARSVHRGEFYLGYALIPVVDIVKAQREAESKMRSSLVVKAAVVPAPAPAGPQLPAGAVATDFKKAEDSNKPADAAADKPAADTAAATKEKEEDKTDERYTKGKAEEWVKKLGSEAEEPLALDPLNYQLAVPPEISSSAALVKMEITIVAALCRREPKPDEHEQVLDKSEKQSALTDAIRGKVSKKKKRFKVRGVERSSDRSCWDAGRRLRFGSDVHHAEYHRARLSVHRHGRRVPQQHEGRPALLPAQTPDGARL